MYNNLFELLKEKNLKLVSAESVTGGFFINNIIKISGASEVVNGSFVCYSNEYKYDVLNVSRDIEIVSKEMADELAINSRLKTSSDISISFTGNASPNGIEDKERGLVYISISTKDIISSYEYISDKNTREEIIEDIANHGEKLLINFIRKNH